jgi:filamentous hemagglutinin family protein
LRIAGLWLGGFRPVWLVCFVACRPMKNSISPIRLAAVARHAARWQNSCSAWVLAGLGLLGLSLPSSSQAQAAGTVLPARTLPVPRAVVGGRAVITTPAAGARSVLTVDQATQRAIIDWKSFNISRDSEVIFRQPNSTASALNRIYSADPSIIQGKLTANGQVLLINQNGILFDRGAQINTQSLIAATLNLKMSNADFMAGQPLSKGGLTTPAFEGAYDDSGAFMALRADGSLPAKVGIGEHGPADAPAPIINANAGGSIMVFAPSINNQSSLISSPDGQVILAAGAKAYLALNDDPNDLTLRGYRVEVEAAADGPGVNLSSLIRNAGSISADRGNVTLAALAINQEGRISAKTAVQTNGSIYLKARTKDSAQSGTVSFKQGSTTEVMPDTADKTTVADSDSYAANRGVIDVSGRTIDSAGTIQAAGGRIALNASDAADATGARVYLAEGSVTSVAGVWADVDYKKNLQTLRVTSNELKNSPNQKNSFLKGATVMVDLREGNNILALDGYRAIVPRTVAEKAAAGGELQISSSGSVIQRTGSLLDASGGGYRYDGGFVSTSQLLGADNKVYNISTAPEQRTYTTLLGYYEKNYERWGQTDRLIDPLGLARVYNPAYVQGLGGGSISINSGAGLVLDGTLKGGVTVGPRQLSKAPVGAKLTIGEYVPSTKSFSTSQRIGNLMLRQQAADTLGAGFSSSSELSDAQRDVLNLASEQLFGKASQTADGRVETSFGEVELNIDGRIEVPANVSVVSDVGAKLTLRSPQIDIAGDIRLPAGTLLIRPTLPQTELITPELGTTTERVTVRGGAELSTAGVWISNASRTGDFVGDPLPSGRLMADGSITSAINGGNITIQIDDPEYQTRLERGSSLDVGGGGSINRRQAVTGGKGGKLKIANGTANQTSSDWLQADLSGFAIGNGGELELNLSRAEIGGAGLLSGSTTRFMPELFSERGFSKITINATDSIEIAKDTVLTVQQKNLVVDPLLAAQLATGGDLSTITTTQLLPDWKRSAASLALNAKGGGATGVSNLVMNEGASIQADPKAEILLSAVNALEVNGSITAPGGQINLALNGPLELSEADLHIGGKARLSTRGVFVQTPNDVGLTQGTLVGGGTVTVSAKNAGVQIDDGAVIDVSGVNQTVDFVGTNAMAATRKVLDGHAGNVIVKSQGAAELNGQMLAQGGSASAAGGSFALELNAPDGQPLRPADRRIVVRANGGDATAASDAADATVDSVVNVAALSGAGFEKLRLQSENRIEFQGQSTLQFDRGIRLDAPLIDMAAGAKTTLLASSMVSMGQSLGPRQAVGGGEGTAWQVVEGGASPLLATRSGDADLTVKAGSVNLYGSFAVNGAKSTRIESDSDIQLIGRPVTFDSAEAGGQQYSRQIGGLNSAGNIELVAAQVYPATRSEFTVSVKDQPGATLIPGGSISVNKNDRTPGSVYSAAGTVTLAADTITQSGRLLAPQGEINLLAGSQLALADGSLTSVSGGDLTVLYGTTSNGSTWRYTDGAATTATTLDAVSAKGKGVAFTATNIDVSQGASVDLSGGGDVMAVEFVAGNGGDTDITLRDNTYAIIPKAKLAALPFDSHTQSLKDPGFGFALGNGRDSALYDSISIGTGTAVPAGVYVLLPARFALLPDAYLVELNTSATYRNLQPSQVAYLANGQTVAAGFRSAAGTSVQESQSVGVVVSPGTAAKRSSDYTQSGADFFADAAARGRVAAPRAPWDAGRLTIENATALSLAGSFATSASTSATQGQGRIAEIDISGERIAVVDSVANASVGSDYLKISGDSLSNLNGSVLLGGVREDTDTGIRITTRATEVLVANSSAGAVKVPELMIAATELIDVRAGSSLTGSGSVSGKAPAVITTEASGALVRLSNGEQTLVNRGAASDVTGDVRVAAGASLSADKSVLIDATRSNEFRGQLRVGGDSGAGGSLALSSVQVNLGDTTRATGTLSGLVLSNADLAAFASLDELVLRGYGAVDLIGSSTIGSASSGRLTLDTPLLRGVAATDGLAPAVSIAAQELTWLNSSSQTATASVGAGSLNLSGERVVIGGGSKAISGFASTVVSATQAVVSEGQGDLQTTGTLALQTPELLARGGSNQSLVSQGRLTLAALDAGGSTLSAADASSDLGGRIKLQGAGVDIASAVTARSGGISVVSTVAGDLTLRSGALLDTRGAAKDFNGTVVTAGGGSVALLASGGAVNVQSGALVDVSAAPEGGAAGRLDIQATTLALAGELAGQANAGERSGSVSLDLGSLADFSSLNTALNAGGFAEERQLRLRSGSIAVGAGDVVAARRVNLAADAGSITVAGTVGTGDAKGGARVNLFADGDLTLAAGSQVLAQASDAGARGGEVRLSSRNGALSFDSAATIDVRAGEEGPTGSVIFGVGRDDSNTMRTATLAGTVKRYSANGDQAASVDLEATRTFSFAGSSLSDADIAGFAADHEAFMLTDNSALMADLLDERGARVGGRVTGGTEVTATSALNLDTAWNLTDSQWLAGNAPGTLTVRSAGNLMISQSIGMPNDDLLDGDTWNMRLVAGADLAAANPLATLSAEAVAVDGGSLLLTGANAKLRTGTGRIDLAAAADVVMDDVRSVIYTAGRKGALDAGVGTRPTAPTASQWRWAEGGGSISVAAGGDVKGATALGGEAAGDLWINEWYRRPKLTTDNYKQSQLTDWWAYRPRFQQAIGTLGGGDIDIAAAGSIVEIAAMLPTSGRTWSDAGTRQVDVQGGGNLSVRAGDDLVGSSFLVGRGTGLIEAGGDIRGAETADGLADRSKPVQLYVMGVSSGAVPEGARIDLVAAGGLSLQTVSNPTALFISQLSPAVRAYGATGSSSPHFLTYSDNSGVGLFAKSGDLGYAAGLGDTSTNPWRVFGGTTQVNADDAGLADASAFPANLKMVAFNGDITGATDRQINTLPSTQASVAVLAGSAITEVGLYASDRAPSTLNTPTANYDVYLTSAIDGVEGLQPAAGQDRIVSRTNPDPYAFELQALDGTITNRTVGLTLPAVSRVRARGDVLSAGLFQNLNPSDISEIRSDTGDLNVGGTEIRGPGRLLLQAGGSIDLGSSSVAGFNNVFGIGGLVATGKSFNSQLAYADSARISLVAGVRGDVDLQKMDSAYAEVIALNSSSSQVISLYNQLKLDTDPAGVLAASDIATLAKTNPVYARFVELDSKAPRALKAYQVAQQSGTADATSAQLLASALKSVVDEVVAPTDSAQNVQVASLSTSGAPLLKASTVTATQDASAVAKGSIYSDRTSIQTYGGSDIDLWAPNGDIYAGLTDRPPNTRTWGMVTNAGGSIRSVLSGNFVINQGLVLTARGGDVMLYSSQGDIDAGKGAKTDQSPVTRVKSPVTTTIDGATVTTGYTLELPPNPVGKGIQTLTSDPDGLGPLPEPTAGNIYLFAPAGTIDAGEAGIKSGGNILINAQRVLNGSNISSSGTSQGVPVATSGSLAASVASSGGNTNTSKASEDAANSAAAAAKAAAAAEGMQKPSILTVEVVGFGDKNCKESAKECLGSK